MRLPYSHPSHRTDSIRDKERGWTLVEILVVILIIGVLSSIAVMAFMAQRDRATEAQVVTDVRNAATVMEDAYIDDSRYPPHLPSDTRMTEDSRMYLDTAHSGPQHYCIMGTHLAADVTVYYDSLQGGILDDGQECSSSSEDESWAAGGQGTWDDAISELTALVIHQRNGNSGRNIARQMGFPDEGIVISDCATLDCIESHDPAIVIGSGDQFDMPGHVISLLREAQNAGYPIFSEGNDAGTRLPFVEARSSTPSGRIEYIPTYNSFTPSFPYLFSKGTNQGDPSWACITEISGNSVSVAEHPREGNSPCITAIANRNNGLWGHVSWHRTQTDLVRSIGQWLVFS